MSWVMFINTPHDNILSINNPVVIPRVGEKVFLGRYPESTVSHVSYNYTTYEIHVTARTE